MMNQIIDVDILGVRRITVDGNTYTKLFLAERQDTKDVKGVIPMTMPCEPDVADQLDASTLPRQHKLRVRLHMAGGGKTGMHGLAIEPEDSPTGGDTSTGGLPATDKAPGSSTSSASGESAAASTGASKKGA
ncbi:hypothetical protein [Arhodomonas sp. AD133]|uniref:hypothetical protein n=1 Tax=Arhodomonas sp. AD133 TaxID=3415009 RepID=UPI003EB89EB2